MQKSACRKSASVKNQAVRTQYQSVHNTEENAEVCPIIKGGAAALRKRKSAASHTSVALKKVK
jgi:hypothetical protein